MHFVYDMVWVTPRRGFSQKPWQSVGRRRQGHAFAARLTRQRSRVLQFIYLFYCLSHVNGSARSRHQEEIPQQDEQQQQEQQQQQ